MDFIVANTDAQALNASPAERRIQLARASPRVWAPVHDPDIGRAAAEEAIAEVQEALEGVACFIAAGMGGGTQVRALRR